MGEYGTDSNGTEKDRQDSSERSRRENLTRFDHDNDSASSVIGHSFISDIGSAFYLFKANIGIGVLALPLAVKNAGYIVRVLVEFILID